MSVQYSYYTGSVSNVTTNLKRSLSGLIRNGCRFKIGITNNPNVRWNHHKYYYSEMKVVYQTTSLKNVRLIEAILVDYYWEYCENIISGGGGSYGLPPYYLYVVRI